VVEIKTPDEIQAMRAAGQVVAKALQAARAYAREGVTLKELDDVAHEVIRQAGATSPFLGYKPMFAPVPYPGVICASLNDAALHGIPDIRRLQDGDLLSIDCGATLDGWTGDAAISFTIGEADPADTRLIETAYKALEAGIAQAVSGNRIGDISAAIGRVGRAGGYGINTDFGGHGVGHTMHEDPSVPNEGKPRRGFKLRPGPGHRHRDRAVVHGRRQGRLRDRRRRLDHPQRRRQPRRPRRAHRSRHPGRPPDPDRPLIPTAPQCLRSAARPI
jgi:methionyl aminopeptidase